MGGILNRSKWGSSISSRSNTTSSRTDIEMDGANLAEEQIHVREGERTLGKKAGSIL